MPALLPPEKPEVRVVHDQLGGGKLGADRVDGAVGRGVVDHDHAQARLAGQRAQARERVVAAVPGEDDGRDHGGTLDRQRTQRRVSRQPRWRR